MQKGAYRDSKGARRGYFFGASALYKAWKGSVRQKRGWRKGAEAGAVRRGVRRLKEWSLVLSQIAAEIPGPRGLSG